MAGKKNDFQTGFNSVKSGGGSRPGMGDKKARDYPPEPIDPMESMPKDRLQYHRNPKVKLAPDNAGNRATGSVGRALDPAGGRPLEGVGGAVMRKGRPSEAAYSGDIRSKISLGLLRVADTISGMDETIMGKRKKGK